MKRTIITFSVLFLSIGLIFSQEINQSDDVYDDESSSNTPLITIPAIPVPVVKTIDLSIEGIPYENGFVKTKSKVAPQGVIEEKETKNLTK